MMRLSYWPAGRTPRRWLLAASLLLLLAGAGSLPAVRADEPTPAAPPPPAVTPAAPAAPVAVTPPAEAAPVVAKPAPMPSVVDQAIAKIVVEKMERMHYSHPKLNDTTSAQLFDAYFKRLDPEHLFFLKSDVEEFAPYRTVLDEKLEKEGNLEFPFKVFARYLLRLHERLAYCQTRLAQPFDYTIADDLVVDRTKVDFPATAEEQDRVWAQELKNQLLVLALMKDAAATNPPPKDPKKAPLTLPGAPEKSPVEKVLRRYQALQRWAEEKDHTEITESFLTTFTELFDPHSTYWSTRTYDDFNIEMRLSFEGIGATLSQVDGYTMVVTLVPGGPAARGGVLKPGDLIVAVGQNDAEAEDVINMPLDKVVRRIRGPKDSVVRLMVQKSVSGVPSEVRISRGEVKLADKEAKGDVKTVTDSDGHPRRLGFITLPSFYADAQAMRGGNNDAKSATTDVRRILKKMMDEDHIEGVVMDLRGNGGGLLFEAITLSGLFIKSGPIVQVRYPGGLEVRDDEDGNNFDVPLVVLTDRSTASAAEIFSAAIQDYGRGVVVGDKSTHGKGSVQDVMNLTAAAHSLRNVSPGALKYTVALYYRVNGGSTQLRGVTPDLILPSLRDSMQIGEASLEHALPWDEIPTQKFTRYTPDNATFVPALRAKSQARVAASADFTELHALLEHYDARRKEVTVTLNRAQREALDKDEEAWTKRRDALLGAAAAEDEDADPATAAPNKKDLYRAEALQVLCDLLTLEATPPAVAQQAKPEKVTAP